MDCTAKGQPSCRSKSGPAVLPYPMPTTIACGGTYTMGSPIRVVSIPVWQISRSRSGPPAPM